MYNRGFRSTTFVAWTLVMGLFGAQAAGMSAGQAGVVLGQPLDFVVLVRLDGAEAVNADCLSADVQLANQRVQPSGVRTVIEQQTAGQARVRVQTLQAMDEPVVSITLRVGCAAPISRRFVVFAEPSIGAPAAALEAPPAPATLAEAQAVADRAGAKGADAGALKAAMLPASNAASLDALAVDPATAAGSGPISLAQAPRGAASVAAAAGGAGAATQTKPALGLATARQVGARPSMPPMAAPRLTLEPALPAPAMATGLRTGAAPRAPSDSEDAVSVAMEAVAQAASAARAAAAAAQLSDQRIATLEQTVEQMRAQAQSQQFAAAAMREQLDRSAGGEQWVWPLLATALGLAGLAAWLAWRLARLQAQRTATWDAQSLGRDTVAARADLVADANGGRNNKLDVATSTPAFLRSELGPLGMRSSLGSVQHSTAPGHLTPSPMSAPGLGAVSRAVATEWPAPAPKWHAPSGAASRIAAGSGSGLWTPAGGEAAAPLGPVARSEIPMRDVSIEELIDLEQQAEFFVVLGQDEAAIDLLVDHLRNTGGSSPLPYLKLLEIYSRTGDRASYERNRARFNHRFNAYAPEWDSDLALGRALEDYPGILPRLEQVWPRPLDAMAELEALLFRKSRGELFELPAYREVLFLYALARDLLDREAADTGSVDLLLPLADGTEFGATAPIPFMRDELLSASERLVAFDDPPTAPVDFDFTIPAQQTSMFDPLEEPLLPRRR